jgi:hypothetical protein
MALTLNSITVPAIDAGGAKFTRIPGRTGRSTLLVTNETAANDGARMFASFDPPKTAGAEDDDAGVFNGIPIDPGQTLALGGAGVDVGGPLYLTCPAGGGTTAYYTDKA